MNEHVTTETSLQQHIDAALDAAWETLKQRELAAHQAADAAAHRAEQERRQEWEPNLAKVRQSLPDWVHPCVRLPIVPVTEYLHDETAYAPVMIHVPGCTPIAAWVLANGVVFEATYPELLTDDEFAVKYVRVAPAFARRTWWDNHNSERDFNVALLQARQADIQRQQYQALADAANRDADDDTLLVPADPEPPAEPTPAQRRAAMLADTAELIRRFADGDWLIKAEYDDVEDFADNRTLLLATVGLTVAAQLARIADALEAPRG